VYSSPFSLAVLLQLQKNLTCMTRSAMLALQSASLKCCSSQEDSRGPSSSDGSHSSSCLQIQQQQARL
jgi:hypothetical protein